MIPTDQTLMRNPRLIPMKGMEHTGMVLFHKVEQLEECHFFVGASQSQVGERREKRFDPITSLKVFGSCEFRGERPMMIHRREMKRDGGLSKQASKVGFTRHCLRGNTSMGLIPSDPYFFRGKHADELNHIVCCPQIGSPRGLPCIGACGSRGQIQSPCATCGGLPWLGMKVERHDIGDVCG
jgi:hypothetical protein